MRGSYLSHFDRVDAVLLGAAVVGLMLYLFGVPRAHPDRSIRIHAPKNEVMDAARAFLGGHVGEAFEAYPADARIHRSPALLDSMQSAYGRSEAVRIIRETGAPAYFWQVRIRARRQPEGERGVVVSSSPDEDVQAAEVQLTTDGRPFRLTLDASRLPSRLHGEVLRDLAVDPLRYDVLDTVSADRWTFRFNDQPVSAGRRFPRDERGLNDPPVIRPFFLPPEARILLNEADASAIARYHLRGTLFENVGLRVDSVETSGEAGRATATVYVTSVDAALGRRFTAAIEVAPTGTLLRIEPSFVQAPTSNGPDGGDVLEIVQMVAYALLVAVAFVVFLRRLRHQLVDVGAALRDGVLAAVASAVALFGGVLGEMATSMSIQWLMMMVGLTFVSLLSGVLIFFLSAAGSTARDVWNEKLQTLDLVREAYVRNVPVGRSLVRGTLVGLGLVGSVSLALIVFPSPRLSGDPLFYTSNVFGAPFLVSAAGKLFAALFITYAAIVNPGALISKKSSSAAVMVGVVTFTLVITQTSPLQLQPVGLTYIVSVVLGLILAWTLRRFDVLTVLVALFALMLLWDVVPGWVVTAAPEFVSALLAFVLVGGVLGLGAYGVAGGRSTEDIPVIVPEYIEDLARRERLERELELARSMQMSFLPRSTPDLPGLDIASVCLPAYEVGGDYYDYFRLDDGTLAFAVGDVSGKGMEAAFYMTLMKGVLQSLVATGTEPACVLSRANELFRRNAARSTFMSMALGVLDIDRRMLTFARAGHNPLLVRRSDRLETVKPAGLALGLAEAALFDDSIEQVQVSLEQGDFFVVYTDGVTEAMNARRELYGEERLRAILSTRPENASHGLQRIVDDVDSFTRGTPSHDDMTLLVARLTDGAHSSSSS